MINSANRKMAESLLSIPARKPTAKHVFSKVKPVASKHVDVHFDRAQRVGPGTRLDGIRARHEGPFALVGYQGDTFFLPLTVKTTNRKADQALGGLLKTRNISIATTSP